jgi:hypothetical protein
MVQAAKDRCLHNTETGGQLVCGRWLEHCPGLVPEFQDLTRSTVGPGCSGVPIL